MNINELISNQIVPQIKQPIWDSWYIKEKIGAGGFSVVYRVEAQRTSMVDEAALKISAIVSDRPFTSEEKKKSFLEKQKVSVENETVILKKLRDCSYIVRYEDEKTEPFYIDGNFEGYYSLIRMELLDPLDRLLYRHKFDYAQANVERLAREIGQALQFAHKNGIIHRDIKPENIFMSKTGTYKLGDFNISKKAVSTHSFAGSNYYMAPEILKVVSDADESYTNQADIYSFGIVLYQLMNDNLFPFESEDVTVTEATDRRMKGESLPAPKNASDKFAKIILKACAFDTKDRYASMDEFLSDLNRSEPVPAPAPVVSKPEPKEDPNKTVYVASEPQPVVKDEPKPDPNATVYAAAPYKAEESAPSEPKPAKKIDPKMAVIAGVAAVAVIAGIAIIPNLSKGGGDEIASTESVTDTEVAVIHNILETTAEETTVPSSSSAEEQTEVPSAATTSETTTTPEVTTEEETTTTAPETTTTEKTTTTPKETTAATTTTPKVTTAATTTTPKVTTAATTTTPKVTTAATTTTPKVTTAAVTTTAEVFGRDSEYVFAKGDLHAHKNKNHNRFEVTVGDKFYQYTDVFLEICTIDNTNKRLVSFGTVNDAFGSLKQKDKLTVQGLGKDIYMVMDFDEKWMYLDDTVVPIFDHNSKDGWAKGEVTVECYHPTERKIYNLNYWLTSSGKSQGHNVWDPAKQTRVKLPSSEMKLGFVCYDFNGKYDDNYWYDTTWTYSANSTVSVKPIHGPIVYRYLFEDSDGNYTATDFIYRNIE